MDNNKFVETLNITLDISNRCEEILNTVKESEEDLHKFYNKFIKLGFSTSDFLTLLLILTRDYQKEVMCGYRCTNEVIRLHDDYIKAFVRLTDKKEKDKIKNFIQKNYYRHIERKDMLKLLSELEN